MMRSLERVRLHTYVVAAAYNLLRIIIPLQVVQYFVPPFDIDLPKRRVAG
jgi:hypothetical protein